MAKHKNNRNPVWERKKNAIMRNYRKMQNAQDKASFKSRNNEKFNKEGEKKTFFERAMAEFERKKAEKERIKQIKEAKRKEREEALRRYTEKKRENFKKLSQKTKKGQPVMKGRIEVLLEKIERQYGPNAINKKVTPDQLNCLKFRDLH